MNREHYVLIVDDDESTCKACERLLFKEGIKVLTSSRPLQALELMKKYGVDLVITDNRLPEMSGIELLKALKRQDPAIEIIVMTGFADVELAIEALRQGAFDFFTKPFDSMEKFLQSVKNALQKRELMSYTQRLEQELKQQSQLQNIVGSSVPMQRVTKLIKDVSASSISVLITGESGTGKELVARAIHFNSPRQKQPFVVINCSALSETLLDSELFGHVKGAFTGATGDKKGLFEEAHTGTIFLDEIGDIPLATQVKLLRVLQEGEIKRVGSNEVKTVDVRVITATNRPLEKLIAKGLFREDLYYRINVISIPLPPLRERVEDVPLLALYFLKKYMAKENRSLQGLTEAAVRVLERYPWPGNVRELENVIERAVVLEKGGTLDVSSLPAQLVQLDAPASASLSLSMPASHQLSYKEAKALYLDQFHRAYLGALLQATSGNISQASRLAGLDRTNFKRIVRKLGLELDPFKGDTASH